MVQLGVKTNKGRGIFEFFFAKSQPEVDREWVAENQLKMARLFMAGLEKYNLESSEEAERVLLPEQFLLVAGYHIDEDTKTREFYDENEELATRTVTEAIYTNLLVGFSPEIQCLVLMKVDADLVKCSCFIRKILRRKNIADLSSVSRFMIRRKNGTSEF